MTIDQINFIARAARDAYDAVIDGPETPLVVSTLDADEAVVDAAWIAACVNLGLSGSAEHASDDLLEEMADNPQARLMAFIGQALVSEIETPGDAFPGGPDDGE